jgi:2-methylcitrate dehydratase PrpD
MHAALDAGRQVLPVDPAAISEIAVEVHPDSAAIVCAPDKTDPRTAYDAKFSLPWSLAALLTDGEVTVDTYAPASLARPAVRALATRVRVTEVPDAGVAADAPSRVVVSLADGRTLRGHVDRSAGASLDAKLAGNVGGPAAAAELTAAVDALDLPSLITVADHLARRDA